MPLAVLAIAACAEASLIRDFGGVISIASDSARLSAAFWQHAYSSRRHVVLLRPTRSREPASARTHRIAGQWKCSHVRRRR